MQPHWMKPRRWNQAQKQHTSRLTWVGDRHPVPPRGGQVGHKLRQLLRRPGCGAEREWPGVVHCRGGVPARTWRRVKPWLQDVQRMQACLDAERPTRETSIRIAYAYFRPGFRIPPHVGHAASANRHAATTSLQHAGGLKRHSRRSMSVQTDSSGRPAAVCSVTTCCTCSRDWYPNLKGRHDLKEWRC